MKSRIVLHSFESLSFELLVSASPAAGGNPIPRGPGPADLKRGRPAPARPQSPVPLELIAASEKLPAPADLRITVSPLNDL